MMRPSPRCVRALVLGLFVLLCDLPTWAAPMTIVVNPGRFERLEAAAIAEKQVDWWDDATADDDACTECFAAVELRRFLAVVLGLGESDISFAPADRLPEAGSVFVLGTRASNPLLVSLVKQAHDPNKPLPLEAFRIRAFEQSGQTVTLIEGGDRVGTLFGVYAYLERLGVRFFGLGDAGTVLPAGAVELPRDLDVTERPDYLSRGFWAWEDRGNEAFALWMARNRLNHWTAADSHLHLLKKLGLRLTDGGHVIQHVCLSPNADYPYNHPKLEGDEVKPADPYAVGPEFAGDANRDGKLTYFEAHPEWYALIGDRRSDRIKDNGGDNYCTSNADATHELAVNLVRELADGRWRYVDMLDVWALDGGRWCTCEGCRKQGTCTDRLIAVVHALLTEIKTARTDGRLKRRVPIVTLAYHDTLSPPTRPLPADFDYANCFMTYFPIQRCYVHALADPACTEINRQLLEDYQGWTMGAGRYYTGSIFIGEYYNVSSIKSLPVLFTRIMAADIPWYYRSGARHFHYMHTPTRLWGTWTLNQYLMARLLWNVGTDVDALLDEYFTRYYPTTTELTRSFYRHLEHATANIKAFKHHVQIDGRGYSLAGALRDSRAVMFPSDHLHYGPHRPALNDGPDIVEIIEAMQKARRAIDDALLACEDSVERSRLIEDERRFAYGEAVVLFYYHLTRTTMFQRRGDEASARHEFASIERTADRLRGITDLVQVASSHANAPNGLDATQAVDIYNALKAKYGKEHVATDTVK